MNNLKIPYGPDNVVLSQPCKEWDFSNPPQDLKTLYEDLAYTMKMNEGIGIAANQVEVPYSVCVIDDPEKARLFVNPRIVESSNTSNMMKEGCLSFPGLEVEIRRADKVRVVYYDIDGNEQVMDASGITARVLQHEIDHLNGIHFWKRASRYHRDRAMKKWKVRRAT